MMQILPFTLGIVAGAFAIKLSKSEKARAGLRKAQESLRGATVSSLAAIETSSGQMREKLQVPPLVTEAAAPPPVEEVKPVRRARPRKPAAVAEPVAEVKAAPVRKPRVRKPKAAAPVVSTEGSSQS